MGDVLALFVCTVVCLLAFVVRTVRRDRRADRSTTPGAGGWLLVAAAALSAAGGAVLFWSRLFSG